MFAAAALGADVKCSELQPLKLGAYRPVLSRFSVKLGPKVKPEGEKTMKNAIILAAIVAAVALGACRKEEQRTPMKLGATVSDVK